MAQPDIPTNFSRVGGFLIFALMTAACFFWFAWSAYYIASEIVIEANVVNFDKGSLYMLGAGIGLAALTFAVLYEGVLRRDLTKNITNMITRSALVGVVVMFLLPQIAHYFASAYLADNNYIVCEEASYQWLFYSNVVYTNSESACSKLIAN